MGKAFLHGNGGGGGTGGTLVVTAPVGVTVTATNEAIGKTYRRTANSSGIATFKGLATGVWSLSISDGETTSTSVSVEVNADYEITLAFFSATIVVTYPANSTCTCSDGTTTFTDTNSTDAEKTVTFTVPNKGDWTVTSTANDGSGKSKEKEVEITAEGQSVPVTLSYELYLFESGIGLASGYSIVKSGSLTVSKSADAITLTRSELTTNGQAYFSPAIDCSQFTKLTVVAEQTNAFDTYSATLVRLLAGKTAEQTETAAVSKQLNLSGATTCNFDLSNIDEVLYLNIGCFRGTSCEITKILFT